MKYLIPLLIYLNLSTYAQIKESFSNTDLRQWYGDTSRFVVENQLLRSSGTNTPNQSLYISRPNASLNDTEWYLSVDLKFNPTSNNFTRIYLASDQRDLSKEVNGYFIQFGESNADSLDFYRQQGGTISKLFTGKTAFDGNLKCDLKVVKTGTQHWAFYTRTATSSLYTFEGAVNDEVITTTQYFGLVCKYSTASRFDQFYFDNLEIRKIPHDTLPPTLLKSEYQPEGGFLLYFNEPIRDLNIQSQHFEVNNYIYTNTDSSTVWINTTEKLTLGKALTFEIVLLTDRHGNSIGRETHEIICPTKPLLHDLVFTELMVDESPSQGLPEHEYLEILNLSNDFISTKDCFITDGSKRYSFPDSILKPKQYYLLCKQSDADDFEFVKNKIPFITFPALNNTGKTLKIVHDSTLICQVTYTDKWYKDDTKIDGGWSLELLDSDNFCEEYYNWKSSVSTLGGTPGILNSVQKDLIDSIQFRLLSIDLQSSNTIHLKFNKRLSTYNNYSKCFNLPNHRINDVNYTLFEQGIIILRIPKLDSNLVSLQLQIQNIQDCYGNTILLDTTFYLSKKVFPTQLLINELVFNAKSGNAEYVELYNTQDFPLNLKNLYLSKWRNDTLYVSKNISETDLWLNSRDLLILTDDKDAILEYYPNALEDKIHELKSWPQLADDSGTVVLHHEGGTIIDFFHYNEDFHNPLIKNTEGVALEKTIPNSTSNNPAIWKSASEASSFGTPTHHNSQIILGNTDFNIHPLVISPNGDGHNDFCLIRPKYESEIDMVNIKIVDGEGRIVKTIAQNSNMGSNSFFAWDGTLDDQTKAAIGQYLIHIERYGYGKDRKVERYTIGVFD